MVERALSGDCTEGHENSRDPRRRHEHARQGASRDLRPDDPAGIRRGIRAYAKELGIEVEIFHSNIEGEVINRLFAAHDEALLAAIINPAGFTRGYPALVAAIGNVGYPTIEVHYLQSGAARRRCREVATSCLGTVSGFGIAGYALACADRRRTARLRPCRSRRLDMLAPQRAEAALAERPHVGAA